MTLDKKLLSIIFIFVLILLSCKGNLDKRDWERAKQEASIVGFEYYRSQHPNGEFLKEAADKIMALHLKESLKNNILPDFGDYLAKYPDSPGEAKVRERISLLKRQMHPDVRDAKKMRIEVDMSLGEDVDVYLPFKALAVKYLRKDISGIEIIVDNTSPADLILSIEVTGRPLKAFYMASGRSAAEYAGWHYTGAVMEGSISLLKGSETIKKVSFSGKTHPPSPNTGKSPKPSDAPFYSTFEKYYLPCFYELIGDLFGENLIINVLKKRGPLEGGTADIIRGWKPKTEEGQCQLLLAKRKLSDLLKSFPAKTADYLIEGLSYHPRNEIPQEGAALLEKMNWQPSNEQEGALYYIAKDDYKKCVGLGWGAVTPLLHRLRFGDRKAAEALGKIGWKPRNAQEKILSFFTQENWSPDDLISLGTELGKGAVPPLIDKLIHLYPINPLREPIVPTLIAIGPDAVPASLAMLWSDLDEQRWGRSRVWDAIEILAGIGDTRAVSPLIKFIDFCKHNEKLRNNAIDALKTITKKDFGSDPDAWTTWWEAQNPSLQN